MEQDRLRPVRFASKEELEGYIAYHRGFFLELIKGLNDVKVEEDEQGAFATFKLKEQPSDSREMEMEQAAGAMRWESIGETIQVRVKAILEENPQ